MDIKSINNSFINSFIPNWLFYNASPEYNMSISNELEINKLEYHSSLSIDINKIQYNNYYQSYKFFESKFPEGYNNIIGFSDVIENMAKNAKLKKLNPLDEINYLK
jgi:hypothetical protein